MRLAGTSAKEIIDLSTIKAISVYTGMHWKRLALGPLSIALFILALEVMKKGAGGFEPILRDHLHVNSLWDGLGFGWLGASAILSGSPIAAMALALQDSGVVDALAAFGMINGSRIGAAFIVLLIGFLYTRRGTDKRDGLSVGLMSLLVAQTVHLPAILVGAILLKAGTLDSIQFGAAQKMGSGVNGLVQPAVSFFTDMLPQGLLFFVGVGMITVSFRLFDHVLPQRVAMRHEPTGRVQGLLQNPIALFGLGMLVTFFTLSVSVSLGLLVPLTARNVVKREHLIPYIMGAGVSTFVDTLVAALLLNNPATVHVMVVEMLTIILVSLGLITIAFRWYEESILHATDFLLEHNWALALYLGLFLLIPLVLVVT